MKKKMRFAFTLVELLVVIAINRATCRIGPRYCLGEPCERIFVPRALALVLIFCPQLLVATLIGM